MMKKGLVSVVIPSKDRADFLKETLDSVFAQTYQNLEIVVVDDGSTFPLEPMLKEIYGDRVVFLRHEKSLGAPVARNAGARLTSGEYIAFLDDDDLWLPKKIERQLAVFNDSKEDVGVVYCGFDYVINGKIVSKKNVYKNIGHIYPQSLSACPVGAPTPLIRRSCFEQTDGFDEKLPACQDWDLWIRLSKICSFYPVQSVLALYRIHGKQISTNIERKIYSRNALMTKYSDDFKLLPKILSMHYSRIGSLYQLSGNEKDSFCFYVYSLMKNPFNFYSLVHVIISLFSPSVDRILIEKFGTLKYNEIRIIN